MKTPPIGLNQSTLDVLASLSLDRGRPITDAWFRLISGLEEWEAQFLPDSLGQALSMLAAEDDRMQLVGDIAVAFDLYETLEYLVGMAVRTEDPGLTLAAAALASHPGAPPMAMRPLGLIAERLPAKLEPAFQMRVSPEWSPTSQLEAELHINRWPGRYEVDEARRRAVPPMVGVIERGLPADYALKLLHMLRVNGAQVRRIPVDFRQEPSEAWLAPWMPIVGVSADDVKALRRLGLPVTGGQLITLDPARRDPRDAAELLSRIDDHLIRHGLARLRREQGVVAPTLEASPLDIGVFTSGALDVRETAFLTATSTGSVYRWAKKLDTLVPMRVEGLSYWTFNQLVAMRAYRYMSELSHRKISTRVMTTLAEYAGREEPVDIAVTANGDIVRVESLEVEGYFDIASGQGVLAEAVRLDEVFRPFPLGGGNSAPGLTTPSANTRVHPTMHGGTPTIAGTRLPCRMVATLAQKRGLEVAQATYPSVATATLREAVEIGRAVLP